MRRVSSSHLRPLVSVLTPSLPERADMLKECELSVSVQCPEGLGIIEHLILVDEARNGCSTTMNKLAGVAQGDWLIPLADDDLMLPGCVDTLLQAADDADIVYSPPLIAGIEDGWWFFQEPPAIPSFALIRTSLWHQLGGYDEARFREEDRDLWARALAANAIFKRVDQPTWVYRLNHGGNKSLAGRVEA